MGPQGRVHDREEIFVTVAPNHTLAAGGLELAVVHGSAVRGDHHVGVVQRTVERLPLGIANADIDATRLGLVDDLLHLGPVGQNGVVVVLFPVFAAGLVAAADTEAEGQTEGIAGDKEFREYDEFCAVIGTLVNVAQDFFDAAVLIKHDGCGLNDGNFAGVGKISHKITSIKP